MKRIIFIFSFIFFSLVSKADVIYLVQISVENEYTQQLESPIRYGLTANDFTIEVTDFINQSANMGDPYLDGDINEMYYMVPVWSYHIKIKFTINKPGHKLHGLMAEVETSCPIGSGHWDLFGTDGIIFHIPD